MTLQKNLDLKSVYSDDVQRDYLSLLQNFPYRPTLFLGLGGTGSAAVSKIKLLFERLYTPLSQTEREGVTAAIPPMYAFLAFDSAIGDKPAALSKGKEWHHLGVKDMSKFYSGIGSTKFFKDWVVKKFPGASITAGCSGFRNLGRLALLFNLPKVRDSIMQARGQIMAAHPDLVDPNPVVLVFGSLSGGTGAGMLLDTCFLVREVFGANADIIGLLAVLDGLPTMPEVKRQTVNINTYCALKELNAFMTGEAGVEFGEHVPYPLGVSVSIQEPFSQCYLFSSRKSDGTVSLPTQDHISSFQARLAFMMTAYMLKAEDATSPGYFSIMNNHIDQLVTEHNGVKLRYIVPGMGQVHFPIDDTIDMFVLEAAIRYIKYQCSGSKPAGGEEAKNFMTNRRLDYRSLRENIASDPRTSNRRLLSAVTYDEIISPLLDTKERYKNRDGILEYGKKIPQKRLREIEAILNSNVERLFGSISESIRDDMAKIMVKPDSLALGSIDFIEDLQDLLQSELEFLESEGRKGVDKDFAALESQWKQIESIVIDVITDDGILDPDWLKLPKAKPLYITFLNGAELTVIAKAKNELTRKLLSMLVEELENLKTRATRLFTQDMPNAETIIKARKRLLATKLEGQSEGKDSSVENILSLNVMSQEMRNAIFDSATHLRPEAVLSNLLNTGWHPVRLMDIQASSEEEVSRSLAQTILNLIEPLTVNERRWIPMDVLSLSGQKKGQKPQELIAQLLNSILKPQIGYSSMKSLVGLEPHSIYFCGGINRDLKEKLESADELAGITFTISDNMETQRINFFSSTLPVGLSGCDIVIDTFKHAYDTWIEEILKMTKDRQEFERSLYHCYPKSFQWKDPVQSSWGDSMEKKWFARAIALSEMLAVSTEDMDAMKKTTKNPKDPLYGLFRVGKSRFWLWPFFEPLTTSPNIQGKPISLGANVFDAYVAVERDDDLKRYAKEWVEWFEEKWTQFYNSGEVLKLKKRAISSIDESKGKTNVPKQIDLWDSIKKIIDEWEIG